MLDFYHKHRFRDANSAIAWQSLLWKTLYSPGSLNLDTLLLTRHQGMGTDKVFVVGLVDLLVGHG